MVQGRFTVGEDRSLKRNFPLQPCLRLAHEGEGVDNELPKALAHAIPQQVFAESLHRLLLNQVVFNVLKNPNPLKDVEASALLDVAVLV